MPKHVRSGMPTSAQPRKFWGVLGFLSIAGGVVFVALALFLPAEKIITNNRTDSAGGISEQQQIASQDSDGDGLKDWEEAIWKTDPQNPDTDNDGTPDGLEIAENRNPRAPGPDDQGQPLDESNLTYALAKKLFESVAINGKAGRKLNPNDFAREVARSGEFSPSRIVDQAATARASDLKVITASDREIVKRYFNDVWRVYARDLVPLGRDDLAVVSIVLKTGDYGKLDELQVIIAALDRSFNEIRVLAVPAGLERFAVAELNYLLKTRRAIEVLSRIESDPFAGALMIRKRSTLRQEVRIFHQSTKAELAKNGITFSPGEGGYTFFQ